MYVTTYQRLLVVRSLLLMNTRQVGIFQYSSHPRGQGPSGGIHADKGGSQMALNVRQS